MGVPSGQGCSRPSAPGSGPGLPTITGECVPTTRRLVWMASKPHACLLQERKVTSMTVKSRERFLVAEWWGKAKVRRDWPGVRCRCPAGPASAVVRSLRSLLTAQEGPSSCPILPCGCCHTQPGRAVGWLGVSWQWCHRLCQCESCPELG